MANLLVSVYKRLFSAYGPQGWWPIVDGKTGACEYTGGAPKNREEAFEIIVGCILTQNTQWDPNVVRAIGSLKGEGKLDAAVLASSKSSVIAPLIKSAGYFNQKTDRIKRIATFWMDHPKLFDLDVSTLRSALLAQHGVGNETADSIILYAAGKPSFVVDAYTKRIMARMGLCDQGVSYDELQTMFHTSLDVDEGLYKEYHALLVELAKRHCKTKPICEGCPLAVMCAKRV